MGSRRWVGSGEVELCLESFGDPGQPTVVLVSGAAASMDWWAADFCQRLSEGGRHVVRYDHRDTGESTTGKPGAPTYDGWQLARDCVGLIEAITDEPVHLVGISMGGGIAQWVALRRPELVASLTLVSTSAVGGVDTAALPGPTPRVSASFASPPPDPDWADPDSYADWVVAGARIYAGTLPLDEPRVRALAVAVHARSHDPAAHSNHWLVVGGEEPGRGARRVQRRTPDLGSDLGRPRIGGPVVPPASRGGAGEGHPGRDADGARRRGSPGAAAADLGRRRPGAAPTHGDRVARALRSRGAASLSGGAAAA